MSERGSFRGGRGRGGRQPQQKSGGGGGAQEKPKKENILDLSKYIDKEVQVKFNGGREGKALNIYRHRISLVQYKCTNELQSLVLSRDMISS